MHRVALLAAGVAALLCLGARPAGPSRSQLEAQLRPALLAWAEGDEAAALAALRRVDELAIGAGQVGLLARVKQSTARSLRRHPGALEAFLRLEERAYSAYAAARLPALAGPVRQQLPVLIQETAGRRASAAERGLASALLGSFGGALQGAGQDAAAGEVYTMALLQGPAQPAALAGLAAIHEKRGEYGAALERLLQVVAAAPGDREARLRLAVVLARSGHAAEAERVLRRLEASGGDDWVRSLASQELARLLAGRGELGGARAVLERAASALPCDSALQVQAAFVAERSGEAAPLDLGTLADCGEAGESARARYTRPPTGALTRLRRELEEREPEWREALGRALARRGRG
jgi:tetratricopeptide (TPR) repeat protein